MLVVVGGRTQLILDFPDAPDGPARRRVFTRPVEVLIARDAAGVRDVLERVDAACAGGRYAAGYLSYEAAPAFDRAFRVRPDARWPVAWFAIFDREEDDAEGAHTDASITEWKPATTRDAYDRAVTRIRAAIGAGDTYQVNYTIRLRGRASGSARALYERLRAAQGAGYHAFLDLDNHQVVSASPELFFQRRGTRLTTRPMKGTWPRGRFPDEDEAARSALAGSTKDRAENLMIVDLLRNDLGRIARTGTVHVPRLFDVERYRTLWQMTSTIEAEAREGATLFDLFAALFPCGSVTGAPKISTMRFIAELEDAPREVYCGAIGIVEPGGDCTFSVPIRTVLIDGSGCAEYGVGGGITWDSTAEGEYDELLAKSVLLSEDWPAFSLIETMRAEDAVVHRLPLHVARLKRSAAYFGFAFDEAHVRDVIERALQSHAQGTWRLRLEVNADGEAAAGFTPIEPLRERPSVAFARRPVASTDRFLFHKTTHREVYESRRAERLDVFDVLLRNERGEVTEFTRGNIVIERDDARWTTPVRCGLLAGTFRQQLLNDGVARERVLYEADVRAATRVWFVNGVREWLEVRLTG